MIYQQNDNPSLQWVIVLTPHWDACEGRMWLLESNLEQTQWCVCAGDIPISVGKNGSAWGLGLKPVDLSKNEPEKHEGDGRAPAGIFALGPLFGYGTTFPHDALKMRYLNVDEHLECVDDPSSQLYNAFVKRTEIFNPDWKSSEKMLHPLYTSGIVVQHNYACPFSGKGSCIFMHRWESPGEGTAGCTAMDSEDLKRLILWLDGSKQPTLVQLPRDIYESKCQEWGLPLLSQLKR
jgi:D-alanyl-D-alanine dipeptidase